MQLGAMGQKSETILWRFCGFRDTQNHDHKCKLIKKSSTFTFVSKDHYARGTVLLWKTLSDSFSLKIKMIKNPLIS